LTRYWQRGRVTNRERCLEGDLEINCLDKWFYDAISHLHATGEFLKDRVQPEQNWPLLLCSVSESLVCREHLESAAGLVWRHLQEEASLQSIRLQIMAQAQGFGRRYIKAFFKGFFVAVPVTVTFLDRVACVARVEGASMQPSLNPGERQVSDVVLLNHWSIRNYEVQRGDIVSLV
uniref:Peptidase S26 domain-containing protein n=3 Tax=Testudinoidea TaxID=8486 RepID=A0A674JXK3_9SAUR